MIIMKTELRNTFFMRKLLLVPLLVLLLTSCDDTKVYYIGCNLGPSVSGYSLNCDATPASGSSVMESSSSVDVSSSSDAHMHSSSVAESSSSSAPEPVVWTHCANDYGIGQPSKCQFVGRRLVRYGNGVEWVEKEFYEGFIKSQCKKSNFPDFAFSAGDRRCEYSNELVLDENGEPAGADSYDALRVTASGIVPVAAEPGAFRTHCGLSHISYDDPLVFPNQEGAAHRHLFFGNTTTKFDTDLTTIRESQTSTCDGGTANKSAYWAPALIDQTTGKTVSPYNTSWYYKEGNKKLTGIGFKPLPLNLAMISHDSYWLCGENPAQHLAIPSGCTTFIKMVVEFKQCWNETDNFKLDGSHMTDPTDGACPASHPYEIPEITLNLPYLLEYDGQWSNVRLSSDMGDVPAGSTAHADWINGWDVGTSTTFIENCLNRQLDCQTNLLGNGTTLY